jgi:branched-chain amino acid transport system ATP-binding protein
MGPSGAGKSATFNLITGEYRPDAGPIQYDGSDITGLPPHRIVELGITQVHEGRRIFPQLSVLDNLTIGSYTPRARTFLRKNLEAVYHHFPILNDSKSQMARILSGGEQQMLVFGRGLMSNPRLMLLDEMSLSLAPVVVNELYKALNEIREENIPILFVEQNVR